MLRYPVTLKKDDHTILVLFQDFPEAQTFGEDREEALGRAGDALVTIIDAYIRDRRPVPTPSRRQGPHVTLPPLMATKVQLYQAMHTQQIGKAELARRLGWHLPQVDRLLDMRHASRLEQLERWGEVIGKRLSVTVEDAPAESRRRRA